MPGLVDPTTASQYQTISRVSGFAFLYLMLRGFAEGCVALTGTEPDQWSFLQPEDRDRRLNAFDDAEHHAVAGAGHYVHIEQPDETIRLIDAFLQK